MLIIRKEWSRRFYQRAENSELELSVFYDKLCHSNCLKNAAQLNFIIFCIAKELNIFHELERLLYRQKYFFKFAPL